MEVRGLESPDDIRQHIKDLEVRFQAAEEASRISSTVIINTENYDPSQAIELAGNHVSYNHEAVVIMQAMDDAQIRLKENPDQNQFEEGYELKKNTIREEEKALFDASKGDFVALKELLKRNAEFNSKLQVSDEDKPALEKTVYAFIRLADALPEKGKPFTPPPPAYLQKEKERKKDRPITFKTNSYEK